MVFDTHCHLYLDDTGAGGAGWLERARAAGLTRVLNVGIDQASSLQARARAGGFVQWSAGLHPNESLQLEAEWAGLERLMRQPDCVALGETGIDRYRDRAPLMRQIESFERHLTLARELDKPVIIHCREGFPEVFASVRRFPGTRAVLHCFSGGIDEARTALDLGLYLSFAGPLTYPKSDALRAAARFVPEASLLVETDAPFLPPQSRRGKRNEPALVVETLARLAQERGVAFELMAGITSANGAHLFGAAPGSIAS